ncbi:glucose 1-dehydrogenase [Penicillium argentinense]|uniref:Glucose 1-dehydrogenase n=1 Tax=Penicillium argentinense TaxID=1131581 RepID=A0A9W9KF34_9EURO|nr:glucose 1-dehydrogenase [Penicillium argentinense]KAJ5103486.1 glucose 1-dehydrogenase [Penicillium argentinense]
MPLARTDGKVQEPNLSVIEINVQGVLMTVSLAVQQFRRQTVNAHGFRGKVVVAGSVCGIYRSLGLSTYAASKHAVTGLNISTTEFYDALESEGLLTPLHGAVTTCEQLLGANAGLTCPRFADFTDEKHWLVFERLAARGASKVKSAVNYTL